jgi:hypothetical protein
MPPVSEPKKKPGRPRSKDRHKPRKMLPVSLSMYERLERIAEANFRPVVWEANRAFEAHIAAEEARLGLSPSAPKKPAH